ncbi:transposase [Nocardia sp. NPDC127606]|uniref:transposase n=1 Tax=Nocardia sp. NPDC127606 TaxID=3345406 RepID=UPI00362773C5
MREHGRGRPRRESSERRCILEPPRHARQFDKSHRKVRARVEHAFARMKTWKVLRDCHLRGDGVGVAMAGVATLANLAHAY